MSGQQTGSDRPNGHGPNGHGPNGHGPKAPGEQTRMFLQALRSGDLPSAIEQLAREQARDLYRFLRVMVRDVTLAEDLVQETLLEAYRSADRFRGESRLRTWLLGIARHVALRALERERYRQAQPLESAPEEASGQAGPAQSAETQELLASVWSSIQAMSPADREVLTLFYEQGLTQEEIAQVTGRQVGAVRVALCRALQRVRRQVVDSDLPGP